MAQARYEYGTSPRKLEPEYKREKKQSQNRNNRKLKVVEPVKRQEIKVSKQEKKKRLKLISIIAVMFIVLLTISYRNSQINESFNEIQNLKKDLAALEKENEQLKVNIENSLNLNNIEQAAKEKLGMQKLNNKQTVYVTLPKKDYVESATEEVIIEEETNWFQKFVNKLFNK